MEILLEQHADLLVKAGDVKIASFLDRGTQDELFELAGPQEYKWALVTPSSFEEVWPLEDGEITLYDHIFRVELQELVPARFYECGTAKRSFGTAVICCNGRIYEVMFTGAGLEDVALVTLQAQDIMDRVLGVSHMVNPDSSLVHAEIRCRL